MHHIDFILCDISRPRRGRASSHKGDWKIWVSNDRVRHHATYITLPVITYFLQWPVDLIPRPGRRSARRDDPQEDGARRGGTPSVASAGTAGRGSAGPDRGQVPAL